jgi:cellulose synthase/poly-beta-1,6-N-acetylglucosamine synthase-like glycosyltransferase
VFQYKAGEVRILSFGVIRSCVVHVDTRFAMHYYDIAENTLPFERMENNSMWSSYIILTPVCLLLAVLLLDGVFRALFLAVGCRKLSPKTGSLTATETGLAYIFPAHNEEGVISHSLEGLRCPAFVIADNCEDKTAEAARTAGARVWERTQADGGGKAGALRWFLRVGGEELAKYSRVAIFDADSQVAPNFADQLTAPPFDTVPVLQGFVQPIVSGGSPVARLAAFSEILSQRFDDVARMRLGWPVPLRGTGMVFATSLLTLVCSNLRTKVEDVEMTIQLVRCGIFPRFLYYAAVGDPKPDGMRGVAAQRARWEQGRRQVFRLYWKDFVRFFLSGHPGLMSLSLSLVLRPRMLVVFFKVLAAILFGVIARGHPSIWPSLAAILWLTILIDMLYYLLGLAFVEERRTYALALLVAPAYLIMWIWSQVWSLVSRSAWLSVRNPRN